MNCFSLGDTAEALRAKIERKSAISLQRGHFDPKFQVEAVIPVMNAAARLVCKSRRCGRVAHLLRGLRWLRVPGRVRFRLAVQVCRCRRGLAPLCLASDLRWTGGSGALRRLRSGARRGLVVPRAGLRAIGDRAFGVAASRVWNSLPPVVTSASSLPSFKRQLKTFLFKNSFP